MIPSPRTNRIVWPLDSHAASMLTPLVGGKGRALAELSGSGAAIPEWFAIAPEAGSTDMSAGLREEISVATAMLGNGHAGEVFAVRSSALEEDGSARSFAGQFESYLFVAAADVPDRVCRVWQSASSERVIAYLGARASGSAPIAPAVIVQRMIDADAAGVAFSADPVDGRRDIAVVTAVLGLGTALVSGDVDADTFRVGADGGIVERRIAVKRTADRRSANAPSGVAPEPVPDARSNTPALDDSQVLAIAVLARSIAERFGCPYDIEWAVRDGKIFLLQARPITALPREPAGARAIWDNSNIAESYGGVTTPLTFTFARRAYAAAYRSFFRIVWTPSRTLADLDPIFSHVLGLVRGRMYYNLLNWYRMIAVLPGFTINRAFMEQMMGVKEALPDEIAAELSRANTSRRAGDAIALVRMAIGIGINGLRLPGRINEFRRTFNALMGPHRPDLSSTSLEALAVEYRRLESGLATSWDAPIANDFFAMIFFGTLRKLSTAWCADPAGTLPNDLLLAEGGMISAEPAARVRVLARIAAQNSSLTTALCDAPPARALAAARTSVQFATELDRYLDQFGDRCESELKLESLTLIDDPTPLLRAVGRLARGATPDTPSGGADSGSYRPSSGLAAREAALERVQRELRGAPFRRIAFGWVLSNARRRIVDRENLRFDRTRLFGRIRSIFVEIGRRIVESGALDVERDIFFLELEEILGHIEGGASTADLRGLVAVRKAEFTAALAGAPPPERFETRGAPSASALTAAESAASRAEQARSASANPLQRAGLGCCPGKVRGAVRVIRDPHDALLQPGEILVAERTDPGWVMLFPAASGILVERGSLLSHAAIISRELGIASVVGIPGLTAWLRDGDVVEFDGATGVVELRSRAAGA